MCNYCNEPVKHAGGTTNIIGHMRRHHGNISIDCIDPVKSSSGAAKVKPGQMTLHTLVNGTFGVGSTGKYGSSSNRAMEITNQIARLIVKDTRPYSMVEGEEFLKLVKLLDPRYLSQFLTQGFFVGFFFRGRGGGVFFFLNRLRLLPTC